MSGKDKWIEVGGLWSEAMPVSRGVPQGNVHGPLLFLFCTNDTKFVCT